MTAPTRTVLDGAGLGTKLLRRAMGRFATGVTIVTTCGPDGKNEAVTVNSFSTVSLEPPLVLWSLALKARSIATFEAASHFAINVLAADQIDYCKHFSSPKIDKLDGIAHSIGYGGCPVLDGTIAHFECERAQTIAGGDHSIFLGRVIRASYHDGAPLIFSNGAFHTAVAIDDNEPS